MNKSEIVEKIATVVEKDFERIGYCFRKPNLFEKKDGNVIYQYHIDVTKSKGGFSLHLKLKLLNKEITDPINEIMKKVLSDDRITFPSNWSKKDIDSSIKERTNNKYITMLTDWRTLKAPDQPLDSFNNEFSIWFYSFMEIDEKKDWGKQLQFSVELAKKWFDIVSDENYLINNTDLPALYLLKKEDKQKAKEKFESIVHRLQNQRRPTIELELFYELL